MPASEDAMPVPEPGPAVGDDKDWTWTTERRCPECGFDPGAVTDDGLADALRATSGPWVRELGAAGVRRRPQPDVWSPLEYGCHVRDVHLLFTGRVRLMLERDDPQFANWDQDATAVAERYWEQEPATVAADLAAAAGVAADLYDAVPADAWRRTGRRSNGSLFTVSSIGRYHLHDVVHHLHDVRER